MHVYFFNAVLCLGLEAEVPKYCEKLFSWHFFPKSKAAKKIWQESFFSDFCPNFADSRGSCSLNKRQLSL